MILVVCVFVLCKPSFKAMRCLFEVPSLDHVLVVVVHDLLVALDGVKEQLKT